MGIMKKTVATLLIICMMFSLVPIEMMAPAFQDVFGATMGNSTIITTTESQAGKGGGEVGRAYRITIARDPKVFLQESKKVKEEFMYNFSLEYPPFGRGEDGVKDTMYYVTDSTLSGIYWAFEKDNVAIARYSNNPSSGMEYKTGPSMSALVAAYGKKSSKPGNPFKDAVLAAKAAKTINSTTELANNMKWKEYAQNMSIDDCKALLGYVLNEQDNMKARVKAVIDENWETDVSKLTEDQAFNVNAGYGGFLVALWKMALLRGATEVAGSYEQAITDYFKNNDLQSKPVTVLIDTCMIYSVKNVKGVNYAIAPVVELYEYVIAVDSDNAITNGPSFITKELGEATTREMITAMAQSSFDRYPFSTTKGWATGSLNSGEKQVYRLIDKPYDGAWNEVTLQTTAVGWAIKVFQLKGTQSHIWMKSYGPQWMNNNDKQGLMDHLGVDYNGISLDGFMAIGNAISAPSLIIRYKVNDDNQATQDICDPVITIDSPAHITMSVGMNADFLSFLEAQKNSTEDGGTVKIVSAVKRTEMKDDQVLEVIEAPFPADDGSVTGGGPAAEIQSAINWEGTIQDFIDRGLTTIDVFDDSIKGKTYEKLKEGNQTIRFQYDIDLKVFINAQKWEFKWTDIVERSGTVPLNTLNLNMQPLDENMGCFTEDMEVIDIPGTYGTDTTQTDVLPSDKEDFAYYTRMMNRYEYTSSVGKSIAANKGEWVDKWQVTGVDDVADGDVAAFAELKSNTPLHEEWEVMAGIPSTEEIYFSVGGAEYKVALIVQYWMNEHSRDRTYTIHFDGEKCEYNNDTAGSGDRYHEWTVPAPAGAKSTELKIGCSNESGTGGGDWTVSASWEVTFAPAGCSPTGCHNSGISCSGWVMDPFNTAKQQANDWVTLMGSTATSTITWTAASDGEKRDGFMTGSVSWSPPGPNHSPGSCQGCTCSGDDPCGNCHGGTAATPCKTIKQTYTVTLTMPAHQVCGPCCGHNMPDLYDTWRQGLVYDYAKISQIRLYILDEGSVDGLAELTGTDRMIANVVSGNPTYFMNIAQMTEQDKQPYLPAGAPESLSGTAQGNTWYGSTAGFYNGIYGDWNRYEAQSSRAGRIRYVLDPAYDREESFDYSEQGDGSGGSFTITKAAVANPKQHDDVIVEMGPRSANCDGMSNHNEFGKSAGNNVIPDTAYGHADTHEWADGCLYTHIIDDSKTNFSNYHRLNSYGYSYVAQELKANDKNVVNYSELYNHHVQRDGLTNKASYSDSADDRDIATAEWKVFNAARRTKVIAVVISDFLIMQTSGGDQSIFYFEKAAKTAEAQEHFQKVKATEAEMFTDNPLSIFNGQACEEPCSEKDGSALIKSGIQGFEIVGGYNGRYDRPADKYKPYSPVTKEFLRFGGSDGGSWTQYNASYNRSNWTEKIGGTYSPHGNHKVYTIFDDDPAGTFNRPKRLATSQADSFKIYQDNIQILPTAPNQFYQPTNAMIWYSQVVGCFSPDNNALDMERMSTYVGARSNVNLGWLQRNKYGTAWMETWGTLVGLELNTKYYLTADGDSNTDSINGVLVYTPVSVEDAIVLPQGDLSINGFTISRDQRVDDWKYPDMNDVVNALKVCTLDPGTCEYRYLDCKYLHETVLAEFDFSDTYQGTEPDYSGDYEHNLKPVTKKNTYQEDGQWITTNKITGVEYVLPAGYTIKSSGFGNGNYLVATGNTAWSIPFSDLGLSNTKSNRVKISMNVQANNTSDDTMIVGFKNVGFAISPSGVGQFVRPYGEKPDIVGSLKSYTNNMGNSMKVDLIFSFSNIVDCEAYINDVPATVDVVQDYRYDWEDKTNEKGFKTREKVLKYVTIPKDEWLSNPPENFATNDIMGTLNIGTWGNTNSTYDANFYLDNLTVTLMGGTTEHTSACYERTTIHTSTKIHVCDANCYLKEDLYTCDGEPNANYQLGCNNSPLNYYGKPACGLAVSGTHTYSVITSDDDGGSGLEAYISYYLTKGQTVKIQMGGYNGGSGTATLMVYNPDGSVLHNSGSQSYSGYFSGPNSYIYEFAVMTTGTYVFRTPDFSNDPYLGLYLMDGHKHFGSPGSSPNGCYHTKNTHVHTGTAGTNSPNGCYTLPTGHVHNLSVTKLTCGKTESTVVNTLWNSGSGSISGSGSGDYGVMINYGTAAYDGYVTATSSDSNSSDDHQVWIFVNGSSVATASNGATCTYNFTKGQTVEVYAKDWDNGSQWSSEAYYKQGHAHSNSCYSTVKTECEYMPAGTYVCTGIKNTITDFNTHKHTVECLTKFENADPVTFFYTGGVQTFKVPYTDNYKVEVYGPGANAKSGYASAVVKLNQGDLLYVYVGGAGGYNSYQSDIRFVPYTTIPTGIDGVEKDILEKNNAASAATIMMKAGRTLDTVATYNLQGYGLGSVTKSVMGNSTDGRIIFTPLNQNPPKNPTILEQILNGNIPEEEVKIYLGDQLAQTIIDTAQVFKTYQNFTWNNYQGVTKVSNNLTFANNSIISNVVTQNAYEFYIPVSISAKTLRQVRITLDNNTAATQIGVAINGGNKQIYKAMSANTKNQVITIDVSNTWWNDNITSLYFNTAVGTPTGTTAVKKIELIGHANVSQDVSGYGYTTLKTISSFSSADTKGFTARNNATISYNGTNMRVTSTGNDPITDWNTINTIDTNAVKAIKIVFKNNSGTATTGQLFYGGTMGVESETNSFTWDVGTTKNTQTVWIDTVNHISYNETTGVWHSKGSGWTGTVNKMRFDWSTLTSGSTDVVSITFIGNGSATGTGSYSYKSSVVHSSGKTWPVNYTGGSQTVTLLPGTYKLEVWGAQGGAYNQGESAGGKGGYASGQITLSTKTNLTVNVGGQGATTIVNNASYPGTGGWNGGGSSPSSSYNGTHGGGGGGKTDILNGSTYLIAAGGGGGGGHSAGAGAVGGASLSNYGSGGTGGYCNNRGSGGTSYIGGVTGGTYSSGQQTGNGKAVITALVDIYDSVLTQDKVTITASTPTTKNLIAYYRNPLQNETARKTILDNFELIPDYVGGQYNPIWLCKFEKINFHDCKDCNTYIELDCNEPHHKGLTYDQNGNLVYDNNKKPLCKEHYAGANKICWSACGDDNKHKNTKDQVIVDTGGGTEVLQLAEYLQLDEGFTIYFPNIGDFAGNNALGLAHPQITRGYGYKDRMDTTRWTREKRVKFPFDVIFEEVDGSMNIYAANSWIELDVPTEYFNFYLLVENHEMANASVEFECEAVNCGTTTGVQPKGGLAYDSMIANAYTDALAKFLENYLNEWYKDILDEGYEIPHAKPKGENNNEGSGKRIAFDSWGIMDFWKTKQEEEAEVLRAVVDDIDEQIEIDFEGSFTDFMIDHTHRGMNEDLKPITSNDNKVRVNNALRSDSLRHLHGAYKHFYLDVIGRIGNFAIVDTEDFRFSNFFKVPIISKNDTEGLNDPNNWLVEGLILEVDDSVQNLYLGDTYDIRGNKAQVNTRWLDTYGTESWMTGTLTGGGRNINNPNLMSQILTGEVNNIEILKQEQLRYGYDIYTSIVTFGSYDNGQIQVVPKYYALKVTDKDLTNVPPEYNVPKGTYVPLDVYSNEDGAFSPVNIFNNAGNGNPNIGNIPMFDYVFNLDWTEEANRRNYTLEEIARTNRVKEFYKTVLYDLGGIEEGADYNPDDLPILEIIEYIIPEGRSNYLGTCQYIMMGAEHRTFIGSPNSYDNNPGGDAIWSSRAGNTNFGVDKGDFENAYNPGGGRAIDDIYFERAVQRWHGKLGLPSSSVFVPHGETLSEDSMEWIQGKNEDDWVIVCTAEMIAIGPIWNIHYSQPWFTQMDIYGETYSTGAHYPGHRVENDEGNSVPCSQCLPPIIAIFGKTSVEDVEIVQIY